MFSQHEAEEYTFFNEGGNNHVHEITGPLQGIYYSVYFHQGIDYKSHVATDIKTQPANT